MSKKELFGVEFSSVGTYRRKSDEPISDLFLDDLFRNCKSLKLLLVIYILPEGSYLSLVALQQLNEMKSGRFSDPISFTTLEDLTLQMKMLSIKNRAVNIYRGIKSTLLVPFTSFLAASGKTSPAAGQLSDLLTNCSLCLSDLSAVLITGPYAKTDTAYFLQTTSSFRCISDIPSSFHKSPPFFTQNVQYSKFCEPYECVKIKRFPLAIMPDSPTIEEISDDFEAIDISECLATNKQIVSSIDHLKKRIRDEEETYNVLKKFRTQPPDVKINLPVLGKRQSSDSTSDEIFIPPRKLACRAKRIVNHPLS